MLRRTALKLLGAAIAVPFIGWPVRRAARWSKWNLWIGGDDGLFYNPDSWSHGRVPTEGASIVVDGGKVEIPDDAQFTNLALIGPGHVYMEADPKNVITRKIESLTIAQSATCTIGTAGSRVAVVACERDDGECVC